MPDTSTPATPAVSVSTILSDQNFKGLPVEERRKVLMQADPNFSGLPHEEQNKVINPDYYAQQGRGAFSLSTGLPPRSASAVAGYEAKEVGGGLADIGKGIVGMFRAPETNEEQQLEDTQAIPGVGRVLVAGKRAAEGLVAPLAYITDKGKRDELAGTVSDLWNSKYGVAALAYVTPRALGQAAGTYFTGKAAEAIPGALKATPEVLKSAVRSYTGTGKAVVQNAVEKAATDYAGDVASVTDKNQAKIVAHAEKVNDVAVRQGKLDAKVQEQNEAALKDHEAETKKVEEINQAGQEAVGKRQELAKNVTDRATQIGQRLQAVEERVRAEGNHKYAQVREAVGDDSIPASEMVPEVLKARDMLKGSEENIKQFTELMRKGEEQPLQTSMGEAKPGDRLYDMLKQQGALPEGEALTFDDLQGYRSEINSKMAAHNLPGDVYQALKSVRDALTEKMQTMADAHDAGPLLKDANDFWSKFTDTFHNMRPVSLKGSPLARSLRAIDPPYIAAPFLGKAGARAISMLDHYSPDLAMEVRKMVDDHTVMRDLPRKFTDKELPAPPVTKTSPTLSQPKPTNFEPPPVRPDMVEVIRQAKVHGLRSVSSRLSTLTGWDMIAMGYGAKEIAQGEVPYAMGYTILKHGTGALLDHPAVVKWLSDPSPSDFTAIEQMTRNDPKLRAQVQDVLGGTLVKQARAGNRIPVSPKLKDLLGPEQTSRVIVATIGMSKKGKRTAQSVEKEATEGVDAVGNQK